MGCLEERKQEDRTSRRVLNFDFQNDGPGEGIHPEDFYIHWRGALKVDLTGSYEIVIRSTCAFICYLGDYDRELINNRVQSGDQTEFRQTVVLTAGRVYPLQIELFQRKRKTAQPPARIALSWIPPGGAEQIVPRRNLLPASAPATFSLQTQLPPDDRSMGYDAASQSIASGTTRRPPARSSLPGSPPNELWPRYRRQHREESDENRARLRNFLTEVVATAFRGPLDDGRAGSTSINRLTSAKMTPKPSGAVCWLHLSPPASSTPRSMGSLGLAARRQPSGADSV